MLTLSHITQKLLQMSLGLQKIELEFVQLAQNLLIHLKGKQLVKRRFLQLWSVCTRDFVDVSAIFGTYFIFNAFKKYKAQCILL